MFEKELKLRGHNIAAIINSCMRYSAAMIEPSYGTGFIKKVNTIASGGVRGYKIKVLTDGDIKNDTLCRICNAKGTNWSDSQHLQDLQTRHRLGLEPGKVYTLYSLVNNMTKVNY